MTWKMTGAFRESKSNLEGSQQLTQSANETFVINTWKKERANTTYRIGQRRVNMTWKMTGAFRESKSNLEGSQWLTESVNETFVINSW